MDEKRLNSITNNLWVAVIGSRTMQNKEVVFNYLHKNKAKISVIVSGGAVGPDSFAEEWAKVNGVPFLGFYAKWHEDDGQINRGAGFKRNHLIIKNSDVVVAFWDGRSNGTKHSLEIAEKYNKRIILLNFNGEVIQNVTKINTEQQPSQIKQNNIPTQQPLNTSEDLTEEDFL